ncbi:hypothetical protein K435DRAFT_400864 [Dendrothele bispora CBS 962.96]|uniref:Uncharacterized protein n=1 Tax=Dendrothele bispora (strain CBS 962.96) TaxID=1314807 RepID=A0A4S8L7R8_DENBC|nr:hypothetical protein K435DRAFT_400864 [Dendrothele bispora CBS 962.96]
MVKARALDTLEGEEQGAPGMVVDKVDEQGEEGEADDEEEKEKEWQGVVKKQTSRKTKAQKKKAAKLLAEVTS